MQFNLELLQLREFKRALKVLQFSFFEDYIAFELLNSLTEVNVLFEKLLHLIVRLLNLL